MATLTEEIIRRRFRTLAHSVGVPDASRIGQHEVVSNEVLEALDAAGHDLQIFLRGLSGKEKEQAVAEFLGFQDSLRTAGLQSLTEQGFRSKFLRYVPND